MEKPWEKMSTDEKLEYLKQVTAPKQGTLMVAAMVDDINDRLKKLEKDFYLVWQKVDKL